MTDAPANVVTPQDARRLASVDARIRDLLSDYEPHRRSELLEVSNNAAINSSISRLRRQGHTIKCKPNGDRANPTYQLLPPPIPEEDAAYWGYTEQELDHMMNQD